MKKGANNIVHFNEPDYIIFDFDENFFCSRKENLIQNKNRVKGYKLDIKKNKDVPPIKSNNKIFRIKKSRYF